MLKQGGFDVVLGNPPWERIKLQEQEFFATRDTQIVNAPNKAARTRLINQLAEVNPGLLKEFEEAKHDAEAESKFVREAARFPLTAVGDINTYTLFAELSKRIVSSSGRSGIIVPTGIATDDTCKQFFGDLNKTKALASLYDFEHKEALFPGVHRSYKFCLLTMSGKEIKKTDYAFFLTRTEHLKDNMRQFTLAPEEIELINPNTRTAPVFRTNIDAELTKKVYKIVPVLDNVVIGKNPWGIKFTTMFHMSNDSHLFLTEKADDCVPLYESKMIWQFDHRFGTYQGNANRTSTSLPTPFHEQYVDPNFFARPWYWVEENDVKDRLKGLWNQKWLIGFRDVTNATNERTAIFAVIPRVGVGNNLPIIFPEVDNTSQIACLLANLNSMVFDYVARQKIGGMHMNFFLVKQLPVMSPNQYKHNDMEYIIKRVLELVYTAYDLKPFAEDMGYDGPPFRWGEERRALLRAELDAYYAKLYGLTRDELRYILDPQDVYGPNFPGETFRVLKEKEIRQYGEYRTRRLVLKAWDRLFV